MRYLILNVRIVGTLLSFLKMILLGDALNVKILFTIIEEITVVVSGAHHLLRIQEIFVPNSGGQSLGILDTTSNHYHTLTWLHDDLLTWKATA